MLAVELSYHADVFSFAYGQDAPVSRIVERSGLRADVARLKKEGYRDIVLVGHSAGGLIARQLVEDHPDCGVTKVIQVCTPNGGSPVAVVSVPRNQQEFLACLTVKGRELALKERAGVRLPAGVQFACVVARWGSTGDTDGLVPVPSQWTPDLRRQGVPAVLLQANHREAVRGARAVEVLGRVVREGQPRWSADQVRKAVKDILHL